MKFYTDRSTTPLKFHYFLKFLGLPLGLLYAASTTLLYFLAGYSVDLFYIVDALYQLSSLLLLLICLVGMWKWRSYGPYSLYIRQALSLIYQLYAILVYRAFGLYIGDLASSFWGTVAATIVFAVYYQKRMPLFSSASAAQETSSDAPQQAVPLPIVPPVLYAEPEKIPRKYSGTIYTLTGKTKNDLEVLQSLFEHSDSKVNSITARMDEIGNTPGNPERESLAHQFLAASYTGQCAAYMIAAIATKKSSLPRRELFPDLLRNVQFEWDYMCDLLKDLQALQTECFSLPDGSPRKAELETQISRTEEDISNAQFRIYRLYRM